MKQTIINKVAVSLALLLSLGTGAVSACEEGASMLGADAAELKVEPIELTISKKDASRKMAKDVVIVAAYPVVECKAKGDTPLAQGLKSLSTRIEREASAQITDMEEFARADIQSDTARDRSYVLDQTVSIARSDTMAISLYSEVYIAQGGPHPSTLIKTYNYNPQTGYPLNAYEVLNPDWYEMLPALLARELVKKYDPKIFYAYSNLETTKQFNSGTDEVSEDEIVTALSAYIQRSFDENAPKFVLWQDSISFYFAQYELAPYFAGSQEITIPYSDSRNIVKEIYTKVAR